MSCLQALSESRLASTLRSFAIRRHAEQRDTIVSNSLLAIDHLSALTALRVKTGLALSFSLSLAFLLLLAFPSFYLSPFPLLSLFPSSFLFFPSFPRIHFLLLFAGTMFIFHLAS
jgi:hypothetical protein